jgi:hypothetical protein
VNNATIQAKDAKGTVVATVLLDIVLVPTSSRPKDFVIDPADPKNPNQTNVRVYAPKDDPDYVDTRMTGVGYEIYLHNGFQLFCTGMNIPIDVPDAMVDLNPTKFEPIDAKVYDTLAQANEAIRRAPAKAKGVMPFAYYRGAGGAVIAPTIFSPATTPRIIETLWEARRLYADYVQHELAGIAIGLVAGKVLQAVIGRFLRAFTGDPVPPRAVPPRAVPPRAVPSRAVPSPIPEGQIAPRATGRISPVDRGRGARPFYAKDPKAPGKGPPGSAANRGYLDESGRFHTQHGTGFPTVKDLRDYSVDELRLLRQELQESVRARIQQNIRFGFKPTEAERQAAEQALIQAIDKLLQ